jgi:uncharacterized membrane protein YeiB
MYDKKLSRDRMPCMRTAEILLLWQALVAKDKLCARATVLRSTVGYTAWQKFGTKSKKHAAYMKYETYYRQNSALSEEINKQQQKMKITIIVMNIIWRFYHICLRSCSINHSTLIKGTRITPARRHRFLL